MTNALVCAALLAMAGEPAAPPAAAPAPTSTPPLGLPASTSAFGQVLAPTIVLALLAAAALVLTKRRRAVPRHVTVLETTSLGARRALVVARLGDELLVLGASEAGIALLATRPAPAEAPDAAAPAAPARATPLASIFSRHRPADGAAAPAPAAPPAFDHLLAESAEDLELRRKLARGQAGSVR